MQVGGIESGEDGMVPGWTNRPVIAFGAFLAAARRCVARTDPHAPLSVVAS